jgi:hypothetical protein
MASLVAVLPSYSLIDFKTVNISANTEDGYRLTFSVLRIRCCYTINSRYFTTTAVKNKNFPAPFTSLCTVSYVDSAGLTLIFIYSQRRQSGKPLVSLQLGIWLNCSQPTAASRTTLLLCCRCDKVILDSNIIINTVNQSVVPTGTKVLLKLENLCER